MTNYREILRLSSLGLNKSQIAQSIGCSRTTVIQVLNIAEEKGVCYPLPPELADRKLAELLFPSNKSCYRIQNARLGIYSNEGVLVMAESKAIESLEASM